MRFLISAPSPAQFTTRGVDRRGISRTHRPWQTGPSVGLPAFVVGTTHGFRPHVWFEPLRRRASKRARAPTTRARTESRLPKQSPARPFALRFPKVQARQTFAAWTHR